MPHGQLVSLSSRRTIETNITQQGHHARAMRAVATTAVSACFHYAEQGQPKQMFSLTRS